MSRPASSHDDAAAAAEAPSSDSRHDSVNTANLGRPISASFEGGSSRYPSGVSEPPYTWWANLARVAGSEAGKDLFTAEKSSEGQLPTARKDGPGSDEAAGRGPVHHHSSFGRVAPSNPGLYNEHSQELLPDRSPVGIEMVRSVSRASLSVYSAEAQASRVSDAAAQQVANPELEDTGKEAREGKGKGRAETAQRLLEMLFIVSNLVFFSIMGTLARLGLAALTNYASAPVHAVSIWSNFAGCLVMGFLVEDRVVFYMRELDAAPHQSDGQRNKAHAARKKTLPLYIGLTTGFCGSFTTFSAFVRDMFLAMSNDVTPNAHLDGGQTPSRSFLALMAVLVATVGLSVSGFTLGRNLALSLESAMSSFTLRQVPYQLVDILAPIFGLGAWIAAIALACLTSPHWPGTRVVTALAFAPLGTLLRFALSTRLNGRWTLPVGTLVANVLGSAAIAAAWIGAHMAAAAGSSLVGCILLTSGIEDGFCGCLTTVSTWVVELAVLRRRAAFLYAVVSVVVCFGVVVAIMAPVRWGGSYVGQVC